MTQNALTADDLYERLLTARMRELAAQLEYDDAQDEFQAEKVGISQVTVNILIGYEAIREREERAAHQLRIARIAVREITDAYTTALRRMRQKEIAHQLNPIPAATSAPAIYGD